MSDTNVFARRRRPGWVELAALVLTMHTASAFAPPPPPERGAAPDMADARVNLKQAWQRATDARPGALANGLGAARDQAMALRAEAETLQRVTPGLRVGLSPLTGGVSEVGSKTGALTDAAPGAASETIVRDFLARNAGLYGLSAADLNDLVALGDSAGGRSGLRMLRLEQRIDGRPVFQSETRFLLDRDGRLHKSVGLLVPRARAHVVPFAADALIAPEAAVVQLMASVGTHVNAATLTRQPEVDGKIELVETDDVLAGNLTTRRILFPLAPGMLVPAWSVVAFTAGDRDWYAVVDAQTGDVLWRKNIRNNVSNHDARFRVFVQDDGTTPADSPSPASPNTVAPGDGTQFPGTAPSIVSMHAAMDPLASPNGWIDDCPGGVCGANQSQTLGNNALVCLDRVGGGNTNICDTQPGSVLDGSGRPTGNPDTNGRERDFLGHEPREFEKNFLPPPEGGDPESGFSATGEGVEHDQFRRGALTHLFYVTNWYHDQLFALGFDEASANFQQINFSGSGLGGDRVLGDAQDNEGTDNANFATPPDGTSGRMQMFRFSGPTIDRDGGLDAEIVFHELTHGTTNRLVGNATGLAWDPAVAMGEGWSDFYALSLLNNTNADDPDGQYASGGYATYKLAGLPFLDNYVYGIRRFPYSTDNNVNPLTWADADDVTNNLGGGIAADPIGFNFGGGMEVHNAGELWALSLWEVRSRIIADPAGANGDVPTGNATMLQLVTDALKLTPIDPSFNDARDALIDADCITNACANETAIWEGFADRGLGYGGGSPYHVGIGLVSSHLGIAESFLVPHLDIAKGNEAIDIDDTSGNGNGAIDPGETVRLAVHVLNPWRNPARLAADATVLVSTTTPGVTIFDDEAVLGDIAAQAVVVNATDTIVLAVGPTVACGSVIDLVFAIDSSLGSSTVAASLRVGTPDGTGPELAYTSIPNLAFADDEPRGVFDQMNVDDDFVIADLDFRIDDLTHGFAGDVTAMLRSQDGVGADFVSLISAVNGWGGQNIENMRIDDDLVPGPAVDMVQSDDADAPYTGSWLPVFNAPWSGLPDPIGNLSHFNGKSTRGTWTMLVSDQFAGDPGGTLQQWTMIVTPVMYQCSAVVPGATLRATKIVQGSFVPGGAATYTIELSNTGSGVQHDNPGHEFIDVLPAGLSLLGANATSGSIEASLDTNTVTWNGALAPLGGSATIEIHASIDNALAPGDVVGNQAQTAYDADGDDSNDASGLSDDPGPSGTQDVTAFTVVGPTLRAAKSVAGTFAPGGAIEYSIVIANGGNAAAPDLAGDEFVDVLPSGVTLLGASATAGTATASPDDNTVRWNGSVGAGSSETITIQAVVGDLPDGTQVANQASVSWDSDNDQSHDTTVLSDDPDVEGAADPTVFAIVVPQPSDPDLQVTKSNGQNAVVAGNSVTYTIIASNVGAVDVTGAVLTDVLPPELVDAAWTCTADGTVCPAPSGDGDIALLVDLPAGASITLEVAATVQGSIGSFVSNTATIAPPQGIDDNDESDNTATDSDPIVPAPIFGDGFED